MALLLSEAVAMVDNYLKFDLDSFYGESPTTANKVAAINWAQREVARKVVMVDNLITVTLVTNQSDYRTEQNAPWHIGTTVVKLFRPYRVWINNVQLNGYDGSPGLWTMEQNDTSYPAWRSQAAGTPTRAMICRGQQYLRVWPKPDAACVAAAGNYVSGQYLPQDLANDGTDDSTTLGLPEDLHEMVCYLAAYRHAIPTASEAEGWQRLNQFNSEWMRVVNELRRDNINTQVYLGSIWQPDPIETMLV